MNVADVLVVQHLLDGTGASRWPACGCSRNGVGRKRVWGEAGAGAPLADGAVAFVAAVGHEQMLAMGGVAGWLGPRGRGDVGAEGGQGGGDQAPGLSCCILASFQRGWQMTSIKAGSPLLTTSMALRRAGPRSLGSETGPVAHMPMLCASLV